MIILHPEESGSYPDEIKDSAARRALYDYFEENVELQLLLEELQQQQQISIELADQNTKLQKKLQLKQHLVINSPMNLLTILNTQMNSIQCLMLLLVQ